MTANLLAAGPPEATVVATYDVENSRVVLRVTAASDTALVTVERRDFDGYIHIISSLTNVRISKATTTLYDYTAPLNQMAEYMVLFYREDDGVYFLDFMRRATVTPTPDRGWLKNPK